MLLRILAGADSWWRLSIAMAIDQVSKPANTLDVVVGLKWAMLYGLKSLHKINMVILDNLGV
ncbi:hypothetical protein D3878_02695 [Noviherbaspirillum sedimenti]|uniref:Uncharacterized protein n=1 Tax=Noviherbaspirillum sedimenti TaxID=2320865 RepID=A0A3A3FYC6_9BURK|nr:hypothetical protein D3878_02695 [Noviherbaspirillum sedimenti]